MDTDGNARPKPGDLSVCINCAGVNTYDADLVLQPFPTEELHQLQAEELAAIRQAQRAVVLLHAKHGPPKQLPSGRS